MVVLLLVARPVDGTSFLSFFVISSPFGLFVLVKRNMSNSNQKEGNKMLVPPERGDWQEQNRLTYSHTLSRPDALDEEKKKDSPPPLRRHPAQDRR